jgi:hypothetical protein
MGEAEDVVRGSLHEGIHLSASVSRGVSRGDLAPDHRCEYCIKVFSADMRADEPELKMVDGCWP